MEESAFYGYPNKKEAEKSQKQEEITMKKKLTLAVIIILIIEVICMFIPGVFEIEYSYRESRYGIMVPGGSAGAHDAFGFNDEPEKKLCVVTIVLIAASLVFLTLSLLENDTLKNKKSIIELSTWLPIASFASFVILSIYQCNFSKVELSDTYLIGIEYISSRYELDMNWLFYIMVILFAVVMALSLVIRFAKIEDAPAKKWNAQMSIADEIKKYKELLDSGIITQEEFEAKKSELMK